MNRLCHRYSRRRRQLLLGTCATLFGPSLPVAAAANGLKILSATDARLLQAVFQTMFPHPALGDSPYMECVRRFDDQLAMDPAAHRAIGATLAALPGGFAENTPDEREALLAVLATTPAFKQLRAAAAMIYRLTSVWPTFDYRGPSAPFGGYTAETLVQLDWLPAELSGGRE
ncbi:MAG: hypothetical protein AB7Q81_15980 [Gammaproteobacteria bacterium]